MASGTIRCIACCPPGNNLVVGGVTRRTGQVTPVIPRIACTTVPEVDAGPVATREVTLVALQVGHKMGSRLARCLYTIVAAAACSRTDTAVVEGGRYPAAG